MDILKGIRPLDYVLAAAMVALAVVIGVANVNAGADADVAHTLDSHSALMIPVFVARGAADPVAATQHPGRDRRLVRRSSPPASPAFGWVTRCGFALPLSFAMAYAVARFAGSRQNHVIGLVGILALQIVTLMKDSSTGGLGALVLSVPAAAIFYGIGLFVQSRAAQVVPPAPTLTSSTSTPEEVER